MLKNGEVIRRKYASKQMQFSTKFKLVLRCQRETHFGMPSKRLQLNFVMSQKIQIVIKSSIWQLIQQQRFKADFNSNIFRAKAVINVTPINSVFSALRILDPQIKRRNLGINTSLLIQKKLFKRSIPYLNWTVKKQKYLFLQSMCCRIDIIFK